MTELPASTSHRIDADQPASDSVEMLRQVIASRRTEKVLVESGDEIDLSPNRLAIYRELIGQSLVDAGMAPFHFNRGVDGIAEPWRAHVLMQPQARSLATTLRDELHVQSKEPMLLRACAAVVLVTWLPEITDEAVMTDSASVNKRRSRDEEHLAATGAMVQNLLLLLTAHGLGTYWSSGGVLGGHEVFQLLAIPQSQRLIAAVFVDTPELDSQPSTRKLGAQRDNRSSRWVHWRER